MDEPDSKGPPYSRESEAGLLGAMILDNSIIPKVAAKLGPDGFVSDGHRAVYEGILKVYDEHKACDLILLAEETRDSLRDCGSTGLLASLVQDCPDAGAYESYLSICNQYLRFRVAYFAGQELVRLSGAKGTKLSDLYTVADTVKGRASHTDTLTFQSCIEEAIRGASTLRNEGVDLFTGWGRVDAALGGLRRKTLYVVGGKTSQGKTSVCVNIARNNLTVNVERRVLYNGFENLDQFATRLAAVEYGVPLAHFTKPDACTEPEYERMVAALRGLSKWKDNIKVMNAVSVAEMRAAADEFKPDIIFLDYLQRYLHKFCPESAGRTSYQAGKLVSDLQDLAIDRNAAVFAFSQFGRRSEDSRNRRPTINDLKESGDIENTADVILNLWWPWRDALDPTLNPEEYHMEIAKNKLGRCEDMVLRIKVDTLELVEMV